MNKPVGGRGKKAPYETVVMRIPKALETTVGKMCDEYREMIVTNSLTNYLPETHNHCLDIGKTLDKASNILRQKKSARYSVLKLLQVLFPQAEIKETDLNL